MLNVKQGSWEYQLLSILVRLDKRIEPWSSYYKADIIAISTAPVLPK